MAADNTDSFIVATHALWAGDLAYAEDLLQGFASTRVGSRSDQRPKTAEDLMRATARLRLRQIWQKRGEFKLIAGEQPIAGVPLTIETAHLRAALWRLDDREFLLLGFLKDLAWEDDLFKRARTYASVVDSDARRKDEDFQSRGATQLSGIDWVIEGNPFLRVSVTGMGLIEASALWVHIELPSHASAIVEPLAKLLAGLDPSGGKRIA